MPRAQLHPPSTASTRARRRLQHWSMAAIFDEHRRFASTGASLLDLQTIELFDTSAIEHRATEAAEEQAPPVEGQSAHGVEHVAAAAPPAHAAAEVHS